MAPLTKPLPGSGRLERRLRKAAAKVAVNKAERRQQLEAARAKQALRRACWERDGGRDRASGRVVLLEAAEIHHIDFRSAGGTDDLSNLVTLDVWSHAAVHSHALRIEGDANGMLMFTQINLETGAVERRWESEP